ncbi:AP2/ERF domain containing protein [uncultured Caudovirales phage]|uniref:AP2/ERF domain containing protein n=1 Tax=uncultured Caudovirales phage TaxID=2100421 RepID=A0A6J5M5Y3_9CAUD|nr:AP2/ERF domain containing protein [uncultured Caudovirales phage]
MTYPFAGEIKMTKVIKDGKEVIEWEEVDMGLHSAGNLGSQTLGVSWHKKAKKWQAHICVYKERKYLGLFDDVNEAHKAYLKEKEKLNVYLQKTE